LRACDRIVDDQRIGRHVLDQVVGVAGVLDHIRFEERGGVAVDEVVAALLGEGVCAADAAVQEREVVSLRKRDVRRRGGRERGIEFIDGSRRDELILRAAE
jgi:hypothetical protein